MAFDPGRMLKRYDEEEREAMLDYLLENAKPKQTEPPQLVHLAETVQEAQKLREEDGTMVGLSTGYDNVDKLTRGLRGSQIIVVFGETGHRKSMFVQNVAGNIASAGTPVLFIGLEMNNEENTERFLDMGFDPAIPVVYPASPDIGYKDIDALVGHAAQEGVGLVVVDHLHMFSLEGENDASALNKICIELKRVTRTHGIPMILVSHVSRNRDRKGIPTLNDLKGSSGIGQIADKAIAVYSEAMDVEGVEDTEVMVMLRKSRRFTETKLAKLNIMPNARLVEPKPITYDFGPPRG